MISFTNNFVQNQKFLDFVNNNSLIDDIKGQNKTRIEQFYQNRTIFITGATGFMGKVLVEKLLRSCPDVEKIYVLVRNKRGLNASQRLDNMFKAMIFDKIRKESPESLNKVIPINGDITLKNLGISESDMNELVEKVSVVFHSAATVNFNEPLKDSVQFNVIGTKMVIELCHKIRNLAALVHVSTAYANCNLTTVEEEFYKPPVDPNNLIELCEWLDSSLIDDITKKLLDDRPNTYTFTKALAEYLIESESGSLPVAVVRPSIVASSFKEPLPGWVDNVNGPTGIILAVGKGILRTMYNDETAIADIIPVDMVINLIITVGWYTHHNKQNKISIYNCSSSTINPLTWGKIEDLTISNLIKFPSTQVFRHPGGSFKNSKVLNQISAFTEQKLPVYILDSLCYLIGKKQILRRIYSKIEKAVEVLEYFTTRQWYFKCNNVLQLQSQLTNQEKDVFNFDVSQINWENYWETYVKGARKFVLKEDESTYPEARQNLKRIKLITNTIKIAFICFIIMLIWKYI